MIPEKRSNPTPIENATFSNFGVIHLLGLSRGAYTRKGSVITSNLPIRYILDLNSDVTGLLVENEPGLRLFYDTVIIIP